MVCPFAWRSLALVERAADYNLGPVAVVWSAAIRYGPGWCTLSGDARTTGMLVGERRLLEPSELWPQEQLLRGLAILPCRVFDFR